MGQKMHPNQTTNEQGKMQSRVRLGATPRAATSLPIICPHLFSHTLVSRFAPSRSPLSAHHDQAVTHCSDPAASTDVVRPQARSAHTQQRSNGTSSQKLVSYSGPISGPFSGPRLAVFFTVASATCASSPCLWRALYAAPAGKNSRNSLE